MIDERLRELVKLRMQQAKETLHEAEILAAEHASRGALNRAYYAMFYAVLDEPSIAKAIREAGAFIDGVWTHVKAGGFLPSD